jgi:transposase InsO family protein
MMGTDIAMDEAFVSMLSSVDLSNDVRELCVKERMNDQKYRAAADAYHKGWPASAKSDCGEYWSSRDELTVENDMLFFRGRLVVPHTARKEILLFLHRGHVGMNTMLKRANEAVWWPSIRNEVKKYVTQCGECQEARPAQRREPMMSFEIPEAPGLVVHGDYFELGANEYLVLVDIFSGWMEVMSANSRRPSELTRLFRVYMTRNGVPKKFHADQGSAFESAEFKNFCKEWGIEFSDNSPKYPRGNGIAEAFVKKAKHILATAKDDDDLTRAVLALMQTPVATGKPTPAQLHMGRTLRDQLHPDVSQAGLSWQNHVQWKQDRACKEKEYYDRGTRALGELQPGDLVQVWHREQWQRGEITKKMSRPRSYEVLIHGTGRRIERNRAQIRVLDAQTRQPCVKRSRPFSFFQQRTTLPVLADPDTFGDESESEDELDTENEPNASESEDEEDTVNGQNDAGSSDTDTEERYGTPEPDGSVDGEDEQEEEEENGAGGYRTRQGRVVRPPQKYTPPPFRRPK